MTSNDWIAQWSGGLVANPGHWDPQTRGNAPGQYINWRLVECVIDNNQ